MRFFFFTIYLESYLHIKKPIHFAQAFAFSLVMIVLFGMTLDPLVFQSEQNIFGILLAIQYFSFLILLQSQMKVQMPVSKILLMRAPSIPMLFFSKVFVLWTLIALLILFFLPVFQTMLISVEIPSARLLWFLFIILCGNFALAALGILMSSLMLHHSRASVLLSISILPLFLPILLFMIRLFPSFSGVEVFQETLVVDFLSFFLITCLYVLLTMQLYEILIHEV